jgi:L-cysteine S-thiosulfotransferase
VSGGGSENGFTLPAGDVSAGKTAFVCLGCQSCHTVKGVDDLAETTSETEMALELGDVPVGDRDGRSNMRSFNDVMTVTQLVDIVTFLEAHYEIEFYDRTEYPPYGP